VPRADRSSNAAAISDSGHTVGYRDSRIGRHAVLWTLRLGA
jgi:hypothetical protein